MPDQPSGIVYTFYSYKGGVGRSMCLANVAALLASWGRRVLVVDWDLEAPGIERFFSNHPCSHSRSRTTTPGIVDLLGDWETSYASFDAADRCSVPSYPEWTQCIIEVSAPLLQTPIHLISAGLDNGSYRTRLQKLNWDRLFDEFEVGAFLEHLRQEWTKSYDFVLLDSRTGVSDVGGICTIMMPDVLVCLFTTTEQSIQGIREVANSALRERATLPLERGRLLVVPLPARDEGDREYELNRRWRDRFAQFFGDLYAEWVPQGLSPRQVINRLNIPYVTIWSFGEPLPVLDADALNDPRSIAAAYARIAALLGHRLDWASVDNKADAAEIAEYRKQLVANSAEVEAQVSKVRRYRTYMGVLVIVSLAVLASAAFGLHGPDRSIPATTHVSTAREPATLESNTLERGRDRAFLGGVEVDLTLVESRILDYKTTLRALGEVQSGAIDDWADQLDAQAELGAQIEGILRSIRERLLVADGKNLRTRVEKASEDFERNRKEYRSLQERLLSAPGGGDSEARERWRAGFLHFLAGQMDAAQQAFERSKNADSRYAPAWYSLGRVAVENGDDPRGETALKQAHALRPRYAPALLELALLALRKGELSAAQSYLNTAAELRPSDVWVRECQRLADYRAAHRPSGPASLAFVFDASPGQIAPNGQQYFASKLAIDDKEDGAFEVLKVEYYFSHPSFGDDKRPIAYSPGDGFAVYYSLWGCVRGVKIAAVLKDRRIVRSEYDICESRGWRERWHKSE